MYSAGPLTRSPPACPVGNRPRVCLRARPQEALRPEYRKYVLEQKREWESRNPAKNVTRELHEDLFDPKKGDTRKGRWSKAGFVPVSENEDELLLKNTREVRLLPPSCYSYPWLLPRVGLSTGRLGFLPSAPCSPAFAPLPAPFFRSSHRSSGSTRASRGGAA